MADAGFWFGLVGAVIAIATMVLHFLETRRTARLDEVAYLQRQIEDLQRAHQLCQMRCEELREELLQAMARVTCPVLTPPSPRRRAAKTT